MVENWRSTSVIVTTSPGCRTCPRHVVATFAPATIWISSPEYTLNDPFEETVRSAVICPNETGAALTGLSVKPATAIVATAIDEAKMQELVLRRSLLVIEFVNIRVLSK